jgi:hypothetical protein
LRIKRIRLDDIRPGFEVLPMNRLDDGRLRDVQEIVVSLEVLLPILEPFPPKRSFVELVPLDHGAHGAIKDQDAIPQQVLNFMYRHDYLCLSATARQTRADGIDDSQ